MIWKSNLVLTLPALLAHSSLKINSFFNDPQRGTFFSLSFQPEDVESQIFFLVLKFDIFCVVSVL